MQIKNREKGEEVNLQMYRDQLLLTMNASVEVRHFCRIYIAF